MNLKNESKTLFIPLLGKALMSKKNIFLKDKKAEEIVSKIEVDFKLFKQSKWLSMFLSLRSLIIDELCNNHIKKYRNVTVVHFGCGLDSRCLRVRQDFDVWYDIDYENVIELRKKYYQEDTKHIMIGNSVLDYKWMDKVENNENILIVAEGLTMYLSKEEITELLAKINDKFENVHLIFDAYTKKGVKSSKIKNPVNKVNAEIKFGMDDEKEFLSLNPNLEYVNTHFIRRNKNNLHGLTRFIFNNIYCGKLAACFYKIYEFDLKK